MWFVLSAFHLFILSSFRPFIFYYYYYFVLSDIHALNDYAHYFDKYKEPLLCPMKMSMDMTNRLLDLSKVLAIV